MFGQIASYVMNLIRAVKAIPPIKCFLSWWKDMHIKLMLLRRATPAYVFVLASLMCCVLIPAAIDMFFNMPSLLSIINQFMLLWSNNWVLGVTFLLLILSVKSFVSSVILGPFLFTRAAIGLNTRYGYSPLAYLRNGIYRRYHKNLGPFWSWFIRP